MPVITESTKCVYNHLGNSGLKVSNICLGAGTFGKCQFDLPSQLNEEDSLKIMDRFVEWGGNFIDTADMYGFGKSEEVVGSWLKTKERDRFVIATKVCLPMDSTNPNAVGLSRRHITQSIDASLQRLQTDYVDLYQTHVWDDGTPLQETLQTLNDLVRIGKVRYIGASNVTGWQLQRIVDMSREMGLNNYISLQQQYNLMSRCSEFEPFQVCKLNGLGVLTWSPLKGGFLTGKIKRDVKPQEGRLGWVAQDERREMPAAPAWSQLAENEQCWKILATVEKIAKAKGKSPAQVSLRWLLQKQVVSSVIIGATKMSQLDDNMATANGWELTAEEMAELDKVSTPNIPYPYETIWRMNTTRNNPWNMKPNL